MSNNECNMELLVNDSEGIYIPHEFAKVWGLPDNFLNWEEVKENILYLQNEGSVNQIDYWDRWDEILEDARMTSKTIPEGKLIQDGDLWVVNIRDLDFFEYQ